MTFAVDGYQAFVLEYSVATKTSQQNMMFPAQILDLGKAMLTKNHLGTEFSGFFASKKVTKLRPQMVHYVPNRLCFML